MVPANACEMHAPFDINDAENADLVVIGNIENYRLLPFRGSSKADYAQFDVVVDKVIHGKSASAITVNWPNSTFALPESLPSGSMLIALGRPMLTTTGNAASRALHDGKSYSLVQAACSGPVILNPTPEVVEAMLKVLQGEEVDQRKLKGPLFPEPRVSLIQKLEQNWKPIGIASAALLFFGLLVATWARGRKRQSSQAITTATRSSRPTQP